MAEIMLTNKGKPCLILDGYQHRINVKKKDTISWLCLKNEKNKCKRRMKTNHQNIILSKKEHSCVPNLQEIDVKKTMQKCRKRVREEIFMPMHKFFREEMANIYNKGYGLVTESRTYNNAKTCSERRKILGTVENSLNIKFSEDTNFFSDGKSFLYLEFLNDDGKRVLETENFLTNGKIFFFDGTFKSLSNLHDYTRAGAARAIRATAYGARIPDGAIAGA
ncbi:hypothetical protein AVEN_218369-1 [Araneus ventricosus]|uniref:FLYWCH-type domain-containing protein n=1 Tax=Araneus ventricosus TaxID=182803 RepID=A0A4Y2X127_ARAVE|nr:hypothetical protein AVEN_218369-1 [Araneus ventricosus]